jgi:hypothetical protein
VKKDHVVTSNHVVTHHAVIAVTVTLAQHHAVAIINR